MFVPYPFIDLILQRYICLNNNIIPILIFAYFYISICSQVDMCVFFNASDVLIKSSEDWLFQLSLETFHNFHLISK